MTSYAPSLKVKAAAELELRRRRRAHTVPDFDHWLEQKFPTWTWDWPYLVLIRNYLQRATAGEFDRLMFMLPPRHGKSEMVTVRYSAWRIERDPSCRVIIGAYNSGLATDFSRKVKGITEGMPYVSLARDRTAASQWETAEGGGCYATGVGTGVTGRGGNVIMIDDPVKSREEAESSAYRRRVWSWYKDDLYTRREPGAIMVLIMTRWHQDDLAGRILKSDDGPNWQVIRLPAIAETQEERDSYNRSIERPEGLPEPLGREPGTALNPDRFPLPELEGIKVVMGTSFQALHQQRPVAAEGGMFNPAWFEIVQTVPASTRYVRYWDKGGTADAGSYTAGILMCEANGTFYVLDVIRGQWEAPEREARISQTLALDKQKYGFVTTVVEQEPGSGGKESAQNTVKRNPGYAIYMDRVTGHKRLRAEPLASMAMAHNVKLVAANWNQRYLDNLALFPEGENDEGDASSGAYSYLAAKDETTMRQARVRGRPDRTAGKRRATMRVRQ